MDYNTYFEKFQGIFVIRCQMMYVELQKFKVDLKNLMENGRKFDAICESLIPHRLFKNRGSIVIDLENTLLTHIELKSPEELEGYKNLENFQTDYILISDSASRCLCTQRCTCCQMLFQVRPYTYEFLRAIQPFFELIAFAQYKR
jgi:hypothetical protein